MNYQELQLVDGYLGNHEPLVHASYSNNPRNPWGQQIYTNPHGGASGRGQIPDPWNKIKILFNDCSQKYSHISSFQWFFSWFLKHYFVFNYNYNALKNWF